MTSPPSRPLTWTGLVVTSVARALLGCLVCLGGWAAVPAVIGWHPTTVSSGSMMPRLHVGDVAVSRPLDGRAPALGQTLLFNDPDHPDRLRMHRFIGIDENGQMVTKGDANPQEDSSRITPADVIGVGTLRIPYLGLPIVWLREGQWGKAGLAGVVLALLIVLAVRGDLDPPEDPPQESGDGTGADPETDSESDDTVEIPALQDAPPPRRTPRVAAALGVPAMLATLVVGLSVPAGAAFSSVAANPRSTFGAAGYFTCAAAVASTSPYLWYRLEEAAGTTAATDSSGNSRTGLYTGTRTARAAKACPRDTGFGVTLNGSTGYVSSPAVSGAAPNTFSVEIWFKTATTRGGKLIGLGDTRTGPSTKYDRHLYMTDAGRIIFGVYPNTAATVTSPRAYNDNTWHHVVGTLSSAGMVLYVDGDRVGTDTTTTAGQSDLVNGFWRIGYDNLDSWTNAPTSRFFAGTIDDAAVYLTALTATQVDQHHEAGI